jgi:hypothetical protein
LTAEGTRRALRTSRHARNTHTYARKPHSAGFSALSSLRSCVESSNEGKDTFDESEFERGFCVLVMFLEKKGQRQQFHVRARVTLPVRFPAGGSSARAMRRPQRHLPRAPKCRRVLFV